MLTKKNIVRRHTAIAVAIAALLSVNPAQAQAQGPQSAVQITIPAQPVADALRALAKQTGVNVLFAPETVRGLTSTAIEATLTAEQAARNLLTGTKLEVFRDDTGSLIVRVRPEQKTSGALDQSQDSVEIEEVLVTAQKRVQRLIDVPLSVTTLNAETLERAGVDTLLDMARAAPGLVVSDTGGGFIRYYIRGIGNVYGSASTTLVGVYLDEADVTSSSSAQLDLRTQDIERVEVLKGPQGTLYGAGSSGGTVRFITRDPQLDRFTVSGDVDVYSTDHGAASQTVSAVVNLPVVQDVFGLRIVGNFGNIGGWVDQPAAGRTDVNNQKLREVRLKGLWKPVEDLTIKGMVYLHRNEGDGVAASTDENYQLYAATDPTRRLPFNSDFDIYNLTASYDFGSMTLLSSSTYMENTANLSLSQKYALAPPPAPLFEALSSGNRTDTRVFSQEIRLNGQSGRFNWTGGLFYKDVAFRNHNYLELSMGGVLLGEIPLFSQEHSKSGSLFGDVSYALTERAEVGVGMRYFQDRLEAFDVPPREGKFHSFDPRVYFSYGFTPDVRLYASIADGFRSGGFNSENGQLTTFDPEKVRSYELGVKASLLERRLSVEAALFYSDYEDIQMFRLDASNLGSVDNGGDARVRGIDVSFDWQATERLRLQASGNITDSEVVRLTPGVVAVIKGDAVDYSTDYAFNAAGTYSFDWTAALPGFVRLDYSRVGPSHVTDRSVPVPILYKSQPNDFVNARVGLEWNRWSIELYGTNLTNENRLQDPNGGYGFGTRPRPRTLGVRIASSFE